MICYFDSSALVKLYVSEPGSSWVEQIAEDKDQVGKPSNLIVLALIGVAETAAAIARRYRMGILNQIERETLFKRFMSDYRRIYITLGLTDEIIRRAAELTQTQSLRGYDVVHLASAINFNQILWNEKRSSLTFVTADDNLLLAA
jgi:predicted nucleic acid-binding protein